MPTPAAAAAWPADEHRYEAQCRRDHDDDFEQLDAPDLHRLFKLVSHLPEQCGKQKKGQYEQQSAEIYDLVGIEAGHLSGLKNQHGSQGVLEYVVVESAEKLRGKERTEAPFPQQRELTTCFHRSAFAVSRDEDIRLPFAQRCRCYRRRARFPAPGDARL